MSRLLDYAALLPGGIVHRSDIHPWEEDQKSPLDIRRPQVYSAPFPAFGRLSAPDRLAFGCAALVLDREPALPESTAVVLGIRGGSLSTDHQFVDSIRQGFPSPAHFSATLPSSAITDVAIRFGLKGPNRTFVSTRSAGLEALEEGCRLIDRHVTPFVVVIVVFEGDPDHNDVAAGPPLPASWAFLLDKRPHPGDIGIGCTLVPPKPGVPNRDEQVYFDQILSFLHSGRTSGKINVSTSSCCGHISFDKE